MSDEPNWLVAQEAALNAVLGDYLEQSGNALSIPMRFHHQGRPLPLNAAALRAAHPGLSARIVVLVHGLSQTEACWAFPAEPERSYGSLLQAELGVTPFYLRYNSGRHISQNGRELALLLAELDAAYPIPIEDITLIGHSMGGLVLRSACHYAQELGLGWLTRTRRAFYLGVPHLGSPYEKVGHVVSLVLGASGDPVARLIATLGNLRSAGVKDLRHGSLLDEDWQGRDLDRFDSQHPRAVPLLTTIEHYLVAGALTQDETHLISRLFGDALVRLPSAIAPSRSETFAANHVTILPRINHMALAHAPEVYSTLLRAFPARPAPTPAPQSAPTPTPAPTPQSAPAPVPVPQSAPLTPLDRADAYRSLLTAAIHHGATAVERVQTDLTERPYALLERITPLESPTAILREAHLASVRGAYHAVRVVNAAAGAALHEGIDWLKKMR